MSRVYGRNGIVYLSPVPGGPPVAWVTDWHLNLEFPVTRMPGETVLTAGQARRIMHGPWLRARSLTAEEMLA